MRGLWYGGGFLDGTIERFHDTFDFGNFGRPAAARNAVNTIFDLKSTQSAQLNAPSGDGRPSCRARGVLWSPPRACGTRWARSRSCSSPPRRSPLLESENDSANRYKVSKQADVLMLFYLFSAEELREVLEHLGYSLEPEAIPRNVDSILGFRASFLLATNKHYVPCRHRVPSDQRRDGRPQAGLHGRHTQEMR